MVFLHLPHAAPHLVGVKDENGHAPLVPGVVAQNVHQPAAGGVQVALGQAAQVLPGKDHVVPVHQQVIRPGGLGPGRHLHAGGGGVQRRPGCLLGVGAVLAPVLDLAVGALKDGQQFLVLLQRAPVGVGPAATGIAVRLVVLLRLPGGGQPAGQSAVHMGFGGHFIPLDHIPRPVGTEHRIGGVLHIGVGVIPGRRDDLLGVVAGVVPGGQHGPAA